MEIISKEAWLQLTRDQKLQLARMYQNNYRLAITKKRNYMMSIQGTYSAQQIKVVQELKKGISKWESICKAFPLPKLTHEELLELHGYLTPLSNML